MLEKPEIKNTSREKCITMHCKLHSKLKYIVAVANYWKRRKATIKNVQLKAMLMLLENLLYPSPESL